MVFEDNMIIFNITELIFFQYLGFGFILINELRKRI